MDEAERDVEPAPHAARVVLDDAVGGLGDPDEPEQLVGALPQGAAAHPLHAALEHQVLAAGAVLVDAGVLRHVSDRAAHGVRLAADVVAGDCRRALVGVRERDEDAHGRRLPAPFGPSSPKTSPSRTLNETPSSA